VSLTGLGGGGGHPRQGGSSGRLGVDRVGLAQAAAGPAVGSVNLDDLQAVGAHQPGQPGSVAAGAFDADLGHRPQPLCPVDQRHITAGRGRKRGAAKDAAGLVDDRSHMAVGMGVDPTVTGAGWLAC
jgi:hypothetical protein